MVKKILNIFNDIIIWRMFISIVIIIAAIILGGFTINTKWGSISRGSAQVQIERKMTKIKTQTNYSNDMKLNMLFALSSLYENKLKEYIKENNLNVQVNEIESDVQYYRLIITAINDACEDITLIRYVHNNNLYRYTNIKEWEFFKDSVKEVYNKVGKKVLLEYYDSSKVIMPLGVWIEKAVIELSNIIDKYTEQLLESIKTESVIYYNQLK